MQISINSGLKTYDIQDQFGEVIGQFSFNPFDNDIIYRCELFEKEINKALKKDIKDAKGLWALEDAIKREIDRLFKAPVSKTFFDIMGPLSPMPSGRCFAEEVVSELVAIVRAERESLKKKDAEKMEEYLKDYE